MSDIQIIAVEQPADVNIDEVAFPKPAPGAELRWYWLTEEQSYNAHLVKLISREGDTLAFRGVELANPDAAFGPKGANNPANYTVDLGQVRYVYRERPSTLVDVEYGGARSYALLFLSDEYIRDKDPQERLANARVADGPKWPAGSGASRLRHLENQIIAMRDKYSVACAAFKSLLWEATPEQKLLIQEWLNKLEP